VEWFLATALTDRLRTLDFQVHHDRILPTSHYHGLTRYIHAGVDFLMRDVGRYINEVSGVGFIAEL
jgi:hypothetical protein